MQAERNFKEKNLQTAGVKNQAVKAGLPSCKPAALRGQMRGAAVGLLRQLPVGDGTVGRQTQGA